MATKGTAGYPASQSASLSDRCSSEAEIKSLFGMSISNEYRLFHATGGERVGISTPLAVAPGGLSEILRTTNLPFDEGNGWLDRSFVAGCECDPRHLAQREEAVRLCNSFIDSLPDEQSRAILRACFWKDDEALKSLGFDAREMRRRVSSILTEMRNLLRLLEISPQDLL